MEGSKPCLTEHDFNKLILYDRSNNRQYRKNTLRTIFLRYLLTNTFILNIICNLQFRATLTYSKINKALSYLRRFKRKNFAKDDLWKVDFENK